MYKHYYLLDRLTIITPWCLIDKNPDLYHNGIYYDERSNTNFYADRKPYDQAPFFSLIFPNPNSSDLNRYREELDAINKKIFTEMKEKFNSDLFCFDEREIRMLNKGSIKYAYDDYFEDLQYSLQFVYADINECKIVDNFFPSLQSLCLEKIDIKEISIIKDIINQDNFLKDVVDDINFPELSNDKEERRKFYNSISDNLNYYKCQLQLIIVYLINGQIYTMWEITSILFNK